MDLSSLVCGLYIGILIGLAFAAWIARDSTEEVVVAGPTAERLAEVMGADAEAYRSN